MYDIQIHFVYFVIAFIYSSNKYLISMYYVVNAMLGTIGHC